MTHEKAYAIAELRTWFQLDTWTVRVGLLLLTGIDPFRSDDLILGESGFSTAPNPSWARITARPGLSVDEVDANGWPCMIGRERNPFQLLPLSKLLNLWMSKPGHTLHDRHAPEYYLEWAVGKDCRPFWYSWAVDADLFSERPTEPLFDAATAGLEEVNSSSLKTRQDKRLARLRELGGSVTKKSGDLHIKGITELAASEAATGAYARTEKTIRADLKAAYVREVESRRIGHFDGLGSR